MILLSFSEALEQLKAGKHIKRSKWGGYWFLSNNAEVTEILPDGYERGYSFNNGLIVAVLKDGGGCAPAMPYQQDLLATDWEVVE